LLKKKKWKVPSDDIRVTYSDLVLQIKGDSDGQSISVEGHLAFSIRM